MAKMSSPMPGGASNAFASGAPVASDAKSPVTRQSGKLGSGRDTDKPVNSKGAEPRPDHILGTGGVDRPKGQNSVMPSRVDRPVGQAQRSSPGRDMANGSGDGHMGSWADKEHPAS